MFWIPWVGGWAVLNIWPVLIQPREKRGRTRGCVGGSVTESFCAVGCPFQEIGKSFAAVEKMQCFAEAM